MNEEEIIYQYLDNVPRVVSDPSKKLREDYGVFNKEYFRGASQLQNTTP